MSNIICNSTIRLGLTLILAVLSDKVPGKENGEMMKSRSTGNKAVDLVRLVCLLCMAAIINSGEALAADQSPESLINCDIQHGPCTRDLAGRTVTLEILPKPVKTMTDLTFILTVSGKNLAGDPTIDLGMPGMTMGPNRVELRHVRDNVFEGQGIVVRCPSGRRTWRASVTLPEAGKVEFVFDVLY
jgi:hypothetical protein